VVALYNSILEIVGPFQSSLHERSHIMALFSSLNLDSFENLFLDELQDMYDAEQRIVKALPDMVSAANNSQLKSAFEQHLRETENQVTRLEKVFEIMGQSAKSKTCSGMKGILEEGSEVASTSGDADVKDAALIAAAQRVEHYEIAVYGTLRAFAERLGKNDAAQLLQQTLDEEMATDEKLTELAERQINQQAVTA